jgi:hypothetical protein
MLKTLQRSFAAPVALALIALLALPLAAFANTSGAIAQTGGMTVTLPMAGSGLSVVVQLDVVGNVSQVAIDPVGTYTATKLGPHAVTFATADGTSQVKIKAKGHKLDVKTSAPTLASLVGSGTWSSDLFGTGAPTTVGYTIGDAGGAPTIAIDSVAAPADVVVVQGAPKAETDADGAEASVRIDFSRDGFTKRLDIKVSVETDEDNAATLKITLTGKDKQKLNEALANLVGTRSWAGHLCDGTAIGFGYDVLADGSLAFGAATGAFATAKIQPHGFTATFDGTKTTVTVRLNQHGDGTWELDAKTRTDKCNQTEAADPTVNTPVAPKATKGDGHKAPKAQKAPKAKASHAANQSHRG